MFAVFPKSPHAQTARDVSTNLMGVIDPERLSALRSVSKGYKDSKLEVTLFRAPRLFLAKVLEFL